MEHVRWSERFSWSAEGREEQRAVTSLVPIMLPTLCNTGHSFIFTPIIPLLCVD
jgi:hypothetical protein